MADIGNVTDSGGGGSEEEGELDWDNVQVGFVFSSFSWGYMTTQVLCSMLCEAFSSQIIGGRLAELYGFKKVRQLLFKRPSSTNPDLWCWDLSPGPPHVLSPCSSSIRCKAR